jgi:2-polyprenyl-6-methoxyphenol hydroxylase-like FAD-dependent oxidoreductase
MGVQARTLEFYRQLGMADKIVRRGFKMERMRLHQGKREVSVLKIGDFGKGQSPYPFILSLPQGRA